MEIHKINKMENRTLNVLLHSPIMGGFLSVGVGGSTVEGVGVRGWSGGGPRRAEDTPVWWVPRPACETGVPWVEAWAWDRPWTASWA